MKNLRLMCIVLVLILLAQSLVGCVDGVDDARNPHRTDVPSTTADFGSESDPESDSVAEPDDSFFGDESLPEEELEADPDAWKDKISPEVWDAEPNEEGKRLLAVFLQPLDGYAVNETVKTRYGVDLAPYMDADLYDSVVYPKLEAELARVTEERRVVILPREEMLKTIRATTVAEAEAEDRANYAKYKEKLDRAVSFGICPWYPTILLLDLGFELEKPVWGLGNSFTMALNPEEKALLEAQYWVVSISEYSNTIHVSPEEALKPEPVPVEPRPDGRMMYIVFCSGFGAIKRTHDEAIAYYLQAMYGYDAEIYGDKARYAAEYRPALERIAAENAKKPAEPMEEPERARVPYDRLGLIQWQKDETVTQMSDVQRRDRNEISALRLLTVSELCAEQAARFIFDLKVNYADVYEIGKYTSTVFLWATETDVQRYAESDKVMAIGLWEPDRISVETVEDEPAEESEVSTPVGSSVTDTVASTIAVCPPTAYTGIGVKIGVIEAPVQRNGTWYGTRYDQNGEQIRSGGFYFVPNIMDNGYLVDSVVDDHATQVVSVLAGNYRRADMAYYHGVAPDATVYQTCFITDAQWENALNILAEQGVSVINVSVWETEDPYSEKEWILDQFVRNTWVMVVVSAGNYRGNNRIQSPGHAHNAITVGNAETVSDSGYMLAAPYSLHETSAWKDGASLANKPDIVAPGTNIGVVMTAGEVERVTGTGFATPIVTGVVAQMLEAGNAWIYHIPETVKAALLATADPTLIADSSDGICDGTACVRDKSGAGMVDAAAATAFMRDHGSQAFIAFLDDLPQPVTLRYTVELQAGDVLRSAMTFENVMDNPHLDTYIVNLDLVLRSPAGSEVAASRSPYNNVEIIEYTATQEGIYTIEVSFVSGSYLSERLLYVGTAYTVE